MESIPILRMGQFLLVTVQAEIDDRLAVQLQKDLTNKVSYTGARGVLIDISGLELVDSFMGRVLSTIASMTKIMDAETVIVGMRPAVAITLVELGLTLPGILTALSVESGMDLLRERVSRQLHGGRLLSDRNGDHLSKTPTDSVD